MRGRVSIIIPTYNRADVLKRNLPSYLALEEVIEIIIVDDASTDQTHKVVNQFSNSDSRIAYLLQSRHQGLPAARNAGLGLVTGDYILFGEDDVFFEKDSISRLLTCLEKNKTDIIGGRLICLMPGESKDEAKKKWDNYTGPLIDYRYYFGRYGKNTDDDIEVPFLHACVMCRREVFKSISYDTIYKGNSAREEAGFYLEAIQHGFKVFFCPHAIAYHQSHHKGGVRQSNELLTIYWMLRNNLIFMRRYLPYLKQHWAVKDKVWKAEARLAFFLFKIFLLNRTKKYLPGLHALGRRIFRAIF